MKQVIVIRKDLKVSIGKTCSQVAHASLNSALKVKREKEEWFDKWTKEGSKKVVLKVKNKKKLLELHEKAKENDLPCSLIKDKGLTEIPPSVTCLAIGPSKEREIDKITGHLKLL